MFRVVDAMFPRVLAEVAIEPDDRSWGRVWHALDDRAFAHGAARRQTWRSRSIVSPVVSVGGAEAVRNSGRQIAAMHHGPQVVGSSPTDGSSLYEEDQEALTA